MTRAALLKLLRALAKHDDAESAHLDADAALLTFINDAEISAAYYAITRWYA